MNGENENQLEVNLDGIETIFPDGVIDIPNSPEDDSQYNALKDGSTYYEEYPWYASLPEAYKNQIKNNPSRGTYRPKGPVESRKKWRQEMTTNLQALHSYDAEVYQAYLSWANSLPATQAEQLRDAGYNANMVQPGQSDLPAGVGSSVASGTASGLNSEDPIQQGIGIVGAVATAVSTVVGGVAGFAGVVSTIAGTALTRAHQRNVDANTLNLGIDTDNKRIQTDILTQNKKQNDLAIFLQRQNYLQSLRGYISRGYDNGEFTQDENGVFNLPDFGDKEVNEYANRFALQYSSSRRGKISDNKTLSELGNSIENALGFSEENFAFTTYYNTLAEMQAIQGLMQREVYNINLETQEIAANIAKDYETALSESGYAAASAQSEMASLRASISQGNFDAARYNLLDPAIAAGYENATKALETRKAGLISDTADALVDRLDIFRKRAFEDCDPFAAQIYSNLMSSIFQPTSYNGMTQMQDIIYDKAGKVNNTLFELVKERMLKKVLPQGAKTSTSSSLSKK